MVRAIFIALFGVALGATPALACPVLIKANPRVGATISAGVVKSVTMHFSGPIKAENSDLKVVDAKGLDHAAGKIIAGQSTNDILVPVKNMLPGQYKVQWHIQCECEDRTKSVFPGSYPFTIE